jgi:hypothetical protein
MTSIVTDQQDLHFCLVEAELGPSAGYSLDLGNATSREHTLFISFKQNRHLAELEEYRSGANSNDVAKYLELPCISTVAICIIGL